MDIRLIVIVGIGGASGAILRYIAPTFLPNQYGISDTMIINLLGSLFIGLLFGAISNGLEITEETIILIGTGFLGAFTTMSTFAIETVDLIQEPTAEQDGLEGDLIQENTFSAILYVFITIFGSIFLAWVGYFMATSFIS